jgi:ankyrin repeat protein
MMTMDAKKRALWWVLPTVWALNLNAAAIDLRLIDAVKNKDAVVARAMLQEKADVNARGPDGTTALMWAAHWDDLEIAGLLIRAGADVNATNVHGVSSLSMACTNRSAAMVQKLLEAGANPNVAERTGETPLMTCSRTGSEEAVKSLVVHGANVNATESRRGQTALMWAAAGKHADVVRVLVEHGADIHAKTRMSGASVPVVLAPTDPNLLKREGANVNAAYDGTEVQATPRGGFTPFLFAAQQGDVESVRILLEAGVDVNEGTPQYGSPLVLAAASGHEALALYLLGRGADPNVVDGNGITALHYAARKGMLLIAGYGYDPFHRPPPPNMPELAKALLARGANPNARINRSLLVLPTRSTVIRMDEATPFLLAAVAADVSLMRILADHGADPLLKASGGATALILAASGAFREAVRSEEDQKNAFESAKLAVELGVDINATNEQGQTAMHEAAFTGADTIVRFLAEKGAQVDVKDKRGLTPWMRAQGISQGYGSPTDRVHKNTADLLVQLGAKALTPEEIEAFRSRR